jgi:curli biogenesis system outer membrane secretion channel CsgG
MTNLAQTGEEFFARPIFGTQTHLEGTRMTLASPSTERRIGSALQFNRTLVERAAAFIVAGCLTAVPTAFAQSASPATGAAAGSTSAGANDTLERCDKTLGVVRIQEDTSAQWYRYYGPRLGSTAPLLSMMIMQSNCFVVVERGTGERDLTDETRRARGDEARESGTRGKGQQVVADFLLKPEIVMANKDNQGANLGGLTSMMGRAGALLGGIGVKSSEVGTVLTLVDIRSTVRLAAAEGYSKNSSFTLGGVGWGSSGVLAGSAYSNTDEGKLVSAAFFDSYNKLVVALRQYKAQTVQGGLGEGGGLGVQGGTTEASKKVRP